MTRPMHYDVPLPLEGLPPIAEPSDGRAERDLAVGLVDQHAQPDWKTAVFTAIESLAHHHSDLTTDDIWQYLVVHDIDIDTHEKRAMGAVMRAAAKAGLIEATGNFRESDRAVCHRNPKRVWRSMVASAPVLRVASA